MTGMTESKDNTHGSDNDKNKFMKWALMAVSPCYSRLLYYLIGEIKM